MSQRCIPEDTPTERYIRDVSIWWTKYTRRERGGGECRTVDGTASVRGEDIGSNSRGHQSSTHRTQVTLPSDLLPGVGEQFETAQIQCCLSYRAHEMVLLDREVDIRIPFEKRSAATDKEAANKKANENNQSIELIESAEHNREKITFDTKPATATIKTG